MTNNTALTRQQVAMTTTDSSDTDLQQMSDDGYPHSPDPTRAFGAGDSASTPVAAERRRDDGYDPGMGAGDEWGGFLYHLPSGAERSGAEGPGLPIPRQPST
ncbi:hypothetical protein [Limnoglobus roseus]|nr:hypothetical protein [Limnoglobus roseus]